MLHAEKTIKVLICTKYTLFREGIKALLPSGGQIEVAGEASGIKQAIGMLAKIKPHVVLMDLTLTDLSGWEATRRIKALAPGVAVLIVPLNADQDMLVRCLKAGAAGHVSTSDRPVQLRSAIETAYRSRAHAA
jgi:DNA-binding NarL/FixJ family response regulator